MTRARSGASVIALLVCGACPATAEPPPLARAAETVHAQQIRTAWNRHRTDGADNRQQEVHITAVVDAGGAVRVFESGVERDFSMSSGPDGPRTREETRRWQMRWRGRWSAVGEARHMRLQRTDERCTLQLRWDRRPPEIRACPPSAQNLELRCAPWQAGEETLAGSRGWRCAAIGPSHPTLPWFLADRCVRVAHGPGGRMHLGACPPDPGPPAE